jgi:TPR repeat protein
MTAKLGENIQREWDNDPFPGELWDALQLLNEDSVRGRAMLADLGGRGSTLAMMYLGHSLTTTGGDDSNLARGEEWLVRSADGGSIEGRFQLFAHYERQQKGELAVAELRTLAEAGYVPAMYSLGSTFYRGKLVTQDIPLAVKYLNMARAAGHLPAMGLLAWIVRKEDFGLSGRIAAHRYCLAKIPSLAWHLVRYPSSDRLRGMKLP